MATFLVMAGGTGGHVFPALALADALRARQHRVVWMGTPTGIEARLVPAAGFPVEWISIGGLRGKGAAAWLLAPFRLLGALWQAQRAVARVAPAAVVGMGGFASGPGGLAAWLRRVPLLVHEQNAVPGLTNKVLARLADRAFEAFPASFPAGRARCVGNPVRPAIAALPPPAQRAAAKHGRLRVLVLGGSQGARALNQALPRALASFPAADRPLVRHQAGPKLLDAARAAYQAAGVEAEVSAFVDDMAEAYAWADLVICRSGAMTVSELAAAGVAAILVPFPAAVDDHQTANARWLVAAGAARLLPERELAGDALALALRALGDRALLVAMGERARALASGDATAALVEACEQLAGVGR
jgi:UDP-N-acetylglucosamine--N-acetylmuramyl-(pentapeptide) pyrophosphoryl-undecaprenol N-acetylglucosamine transferase